VAEGNGVEVGVFVGMGVLVIGRGGEFFTVSAATLALFIVEVNVRTIGCDGSATTLGNRTRYGTSWPTRANVS